MTRTRTPFSTKHMGYDASQRYEIKLCRIYLLTLIVTEAEGFIFRVSPQKARLTGLTSQYSATLHIEMKRQSSRN